MARVAAVLVGLLAPLGACFIKPDRNAATDGSVSDSSSSEDGTSGTCVPSDTFDGMAPPCGAWGQLLGSGVMRNGQLVVSPASVGMAGCESTPFSIQNGMAWRWSI